MVQSDRHAGFAGSPSSSEAVNSAQNTPETKLTAFSPEELRSGYKATKSGIVRPNVPPAFHLNVFSKSSPNGKASNAAAHGPTDPFVSSSNVLTTDSYPTNGHKLSPVASSFTPLRSQDSPFGSGARQNVNIPTSNSNTSIASSITNLSGPSPNKNRFQGNLGLYDGRSTASADVTPRHSRPQIASSPKKFGKIGQFSSDVNTSRYLFVGRIPNRTSMMEIEQFFHRDMFPTLKNLGVNELPLTGSVFVSFGDIRESIKAYTKVQEMRPCWTVEFVATTKYCAKQNVQLSAITFEAQIIVNAEYGGPIEYFDSYDIGAVLKELLENYGDVMAMDLIEERPTVATYRIEYYNSAKVSAVMANLKDFKIAQCVLSVQLYSAGNGDTSLPFAGLHRPLIIGQDDTSLGFGLGALTLNGPPGGHRQDAYASTGVQGGYGQDLANPSLFAPYAMPPPATGRSFAFHRDFNTHQIPAPLNLQNTNFNGPNSGESSSFSPPFFSPYTEYGLHSPLWSPYTPGAIGQERGIPMTSPYRHGHYAYHERFPQKFVGRHGDYPSGHHNIVDVERIRQGLDVRTTIMLRNIPNKIDQAMLKDIVDETSRGKYDFMYLRIDFANNCNVGYAFINFEDPYHIIDFMKARAGSRWNRFNSDKVAEVSYATIQGRDCLVQKFRNSSVMLEHPSFRPKIFHTTGPMAGSEDAFPGPDNPSKMRRSVENAEHVGLFAPRAGQNFRDEQRRRRSQYDRGTRLAEMEDAYDIDRHDYRGDLAPYYPGASSLRYRRSTPYLPIFEEY